MVFDTCNWGPLLLAIEANKLNIVKYYIEDVGLNPELYLIKPKSNEENQIEQ